MVAEFCVIGLGAFGHSVAAGLARHGQSVLAIDADEDLVRSLASELDSVVHADATDEGALRELQVDRMSCAVVAIGIEHMEASILTTTLLRQIGVPRIVGRSLSDLHSRVLLAVGAHDVVNPEREVGERVARRLAQPSILERIELSGNAELAEVEAPEAFAGRSILDLGVRRRYNVSVVAIRRGDEVIATVEPQEEIHSGDILLIVGTADDIAQIASLA